MNYVHTGGRADSGRRRPTETVMGDAPKDAACVRTDTRLGLLLHELDGSGEPRASVEGRVCRLSLAGWSSTAQVREIIVWVWVGVARGRL